MISIKFHPRSEWIVGMQTLLVCTIPGALSNEQHAPSWERGTAWFSGPSSPAPSSHCPHNSRESVCPSWRLRRGWAMSWCPRTWGRTRTREPGCVTAKFVANHFFATSMLRVFHQSWRHSPCSPSHRPTENRVSVILHPYSPIPKQKLVQYLYQRLLNTKVLGLSVGEEVVNRMKRARSRVKHSANNFYLENTMRTWLGNQKRILKS